MLPEQENFVDGVRRSLAEAAAKPDARPWHRSVYAGEVPVGFVMLADGVPPGNVDIPWRYYLWRFLIDARFQRRGYGRAALDQVVACLRTKPDAWFRATGHPWTSISGTASEAPARCSTWSRSCSCR